MPNGAPNKEEPGQGTDSKNAPAPGKVEPGKVPPAGEPGKEEPGKEEPKADLFTRVLEGTDVPEKLKGKTVKEALEILKVTEGELTKATQEIGTWHKYYEAVKAKEAAGEPKAEEQKPDFLKVFDEEQAGAIVQMMNQFMSPVFESVGGMQLSYVKAARPDFERFEERAREIYKNFPLNYKMDPKYGWDFAYRFAKAEAEGGPPPAGPAPPHAGASQTGVPSGPKEEPLTPEEEAWRQRYNMTVEEYKKFQNIIDVDKEA